MMLIRRKYVPVAFQVQSKVEFSSQGGNLGEEAVVVRLVLVMLSSATKVGAWRRWRN